MLSLIAYREPEDDPSRGQNGVEASWSRINRLSVL
jgi:hypothetical protein